MWPTEANSPDRDDHAPEFEAHGVILTGFSALKRKKSGGAVPVQGVRLTFVRCSGPGEVEATHDVDLPLENVVGLAEALPGWLERNYGT